jgi:hypothetical protein
MAVPADAAKPPKTYTGTIADGRGTITLTQTKKGADAGLKLTGKWQPGVYALTITTGPDFNGDGSPDAGSGGVVCEVIVTKKNKNDRVCNNPVTVYKPKRGEKLGVFGNVALLPVGTPYWGTVLRLK